MARLVAVRDGNLQHAVTLAHARTTGAAAVSETIRVRWTREKAAGLDRKDTRKGRSIGTVEAVPRTGRAETLLVHDVTFVFAVHAFHPDLPILGITAPKLLQPPDAMRMIAP